jgi:hypothetical protein
METTGLDGEEESKVKLSGVGRNESSPDLNVLWLVSINEMVERSGV